MKELPYSGIFYDLLIAIHKGIGYCHEQYKKGHGLSETDENINVIFEDIIKSGNYRYSGLDHHIAKGLTLGEKKRKEKNIYPRISKILIHSYLNAQNRKQSERYKAEIIPSPLNILYQFLTVPEEPQTASYAFVLCRGMLFHFLGLHPLIPNLNSIAPKLDGFSEEDMLESISSFKSYVDIQGRWPDKRKSSSSFNTRIDYLLGHILSLKGYTFIWYNNDKPFKNLTNVKDFASLKDYYRNDIQIENKFSFRLSSEFSELPDVSEVNNWIFGIPIPIRGADLLFYGGLKKSKSNGLVIALHGNPGVGKTSFALALAGSLVPYNTKTIYISLEENPNDLENRFNSLIPDYLRKLSVFQSYFKARKHNDITSDTWFRALRFNESMNLEVLTDVLSEVDEIVHNQKQASIINKKESVLPATCPLLIVIDNVNELFVNGINDKSKYDKVEKFIQQCRNMGAIVILIAAEDIPNKFRLDYMVDVALHLATQGLTDKYEKPIRVIQLLKTRHQISRHGTHVFHLSNSKGVRISPQVPSLMDKREKVKIQLPSKKDFIHTLNLIKEESSCKFKPFLNIADKSQILVHGHGSSGKAGFGLKVLLTPVCASKGFDCDSKKNKLLLNNQRLNKVLVISFLYPEEYYKELQERIEKQFENSFTNYDKRMSKIKVKAFYPGYLTPEDFVYKLIRLLDEAKLEGEPYTGILLDGLHNVFLQFKNLQEAHMVWPLLYSMLYRYSLSVVTTFTNVSLNEESIGRTVKQKSYNIQTPEDFVLFQQGQKPFLHGLVKAADYFFLLEEVIDENDGISREYWLSVRSSIRQTPPIDVLKWDREALAVIAKHKV